jgi:hypothetical protein
MVTNVTDVYYTITDITEMPFLVMLANNTIVHNVVTLCERA